MALSFTCFIPVVHSQEYKNFQDLEKGDWMLFEMAEYYPYVAPGLVEEVPWRAENIRRSIFRATVTDINNENITLEYRLESIYDCRNIEGENRLLYYESEYEKDQSDSPIYSFSDFAPWRIGSESANKEKILATVTYHLQSGELLKLNTNYEELFVHYSRESKSIGLQNNESIAYKNTVRGSLNAARLIARGINILIKSCNQGKLITTTVRQGSEVAKNQPVLKPVNPKSPEEIAELSIPCGMRIIEASFQLPPNVKLTYSDINSADISVETKMRKFFIAYPCKYFLDNEKFLDSYPWFLSPGDSIVRTVNGDKTGLHFSGRGSEQNNFYYRKRHLTYHWATDMETGEYSPSVLDTFLGESTGFWRRSFRLNMLYGLTQRNLFTAMYSRRYSTEYEQVDWNKPYFKEIIPLTDGWYKIESFESFLNTYVEYKIMDTATETVNTNNFYYNIYSGYNRKRDYYLNKFFLYGYPCQLLNARNVEGMMYEDFLTETKTEYEDFIENCPDQHLLNKILNLHQHLAKLEKGKDIMDTDFVLLKHMFKQHKNKEYVMIFITPHPQAGDAEMFFPERLYELLEQENLISKINLLIVSPEKSETYVETDRKNAMKNFFMHLPQKEILNELHPYNNKSTFVLMRKDGTILSRMLTRYGFTAQEENIVSIIQEDMNRGQSDFIKGFRKGLLGTLVVGFFVLLFLKIYWDRKHKKEKEERQIKELELKAIRSQMNPHFIFNALGSIQNLLGKGANEEANDYLVRFSRLLRTVLNNSEKKLVPLSGEIEQLYLYLVLEQLRFPFSYTIEVDETLETELIEIPGMLIQPFVENAVKHAIAPRGMGNINIIINQTDNILHVIIEDDGPGLLSTTSEGFGMQAVKDEIGILKNLYHTEIEINIVNRQDSEPCTGLKVMLAIPIG